MSDREMPSAWWSRSALLVLVAGCVAAFFWFNYALDEQTRTINQAQRLPPMSGLPVEVPEPGTYTIWAAAACGGLCKVPPLAELHEMLILGFENEAGMVRPEPFPGEQSYRLSGDQHGKAGWLVHFDEAGTYVMERRNLGTGSVLLLLGSGKGMSPTITSGLVVIGIATAVIALGLVGISRYRRHLAVTAMIERIQGGQ